MELDELAEADSLLRKIETWTDEEIKHLPRFYQKRAKEFQELLKQGDPEQT